MQSAGSKPPTYLPAATLGVPKVRAAVTGHTRLSQSLGGAMTRQSKVRATQDFGSVVGRRGAGLSEITGGDPMAHSMNQYGKNGLPGVPGSPTDEVM